MPSEPRWLSIEAVVQLNRAELAETGEHHFVRDAGLLESAMARPQNLFAYGEEDILVMAVALMAGISRAHAFEQGNKRTAFGALRLFLRINGYDTAIEDSVPWADEMVKLLERQSTEEKFVALIRPFVVARD